MSLCVLAPGLQSLLVDFGRERSRALGVPVGGAADRAALALGNALVGNPPDAPALEMTLVGPTLEALHPVACAIFGAPFQAAANGRPLTPAMTFQLDTGERLQIGGTATGARAYLCVAGGFESPEVLGGRSALEPLRVGDTLACPPSRAEPRGLPFCEGRLTPPGPPSLKGRGVTNSIASCSSSSQFGSESILLPFPSGRGPGGRSPSSPLPFREGGAGEVGLRVLDGPQCDWFTDDRFFTHPYEVLPASNRMGVRFRGVPLGRRPGELVSEAVAPGAVQVTNDGLPVVLGIEGQTIGGYPKVAHVIRADLDLLAQLRPGDRVRFVRVSVEEAERAARERAASLRAWLTRLRVAERRPVVG